MNGFVRLVNGKETHHPVAAGRLGIGYVEWIENSSEGILALSGRLDAYPWRFRKGAWDEVSFAPPCEPAPKELDGQQQNDRDNTWYETCVLLDRNGVISTISAVGMTPGTRTTARWRKGKAKVLGRENSDLNPSACFLTPDEQLWNISTRVTRRLANGEWESVEGLQRFTGGRWVEAARFPELRGVGRGGWIGIGWGLRPSTRPAHPGSSSTPGMIFCSA